MDASSKCRELVDAAREINRRGLNQGRSGNLSARHGDGMLISASGSQFETITAADFVETDFDGNGHGAGRPSSEWAFHAAIYRQRPDAGAVVHVHSPWATTVACLRRPIPPFHYMVAVAGGRDIPCAPYATFGTATLAEHVADALRNRNACLLANHGQVALADTVSGALELALEVELLARCYGQALSIGEPALLTDQEMDDALQRFKGYWRNARAPGSP